jgi:hypothetical protein
MGTSSSYAAPTSGGWPAAKGMATRFARQGGTDGGTIGPRLVTGSYVRARGGAAAAAAAAIAGRAAANQLGHFLSTAAGSGLDTALGQEGLAALSGGDTTAVLAGLVDRLAGPGRTLEEAAARAAMITVFDGEFGKAETFADLDALFTQALDSAGVRRILERFLVEYIYQRMVQEIGERLANGAITSTSLRRVELDLHAFITADVKLEFARADLLVLNWDGPEAQLLIEQLLRDAYGQLE